MKQCVIIFVLALMPWSPVFSETQDTKENPSANPAAETPSERPESWRYLAGLLPYEPMYFAVGWNEKTSAKFQFSFKYRFVNSKGALASHSPWFKHLHLGYTQTTIWDLDSDSAPFYDTSYSPSLFFFRPRIHTSDSGKWSLGLETGFEHESNGQGGDDSRSLNTIYARPIFHLGEVFGLQFTVAPKVYYYLGALSDNPDLPDYRGYVDLEIALTDPTGWKFATTLRKGTEASYGSIQVDITFPLDKLFRNSFDAFVYAQYFNGWGESLRSYNEKLPHQIRLGLMIIR